METDQQPSPPPPLSSPPLTLLSPLPALLTINPPVQGDPATRKFGFFFLSTLAIVTIGAAIGIGVGNIAHYRYFGPTNETNITNNTALAQIFGGTISTDINTRQLFPLNEYLTRESSPKTREFWLSMNKPSDDNHDRP